MSFYTYNFPKDPVCYLTQSFDQIDAGNKASFALESCVRRVSKPQDKELEWSTPSDDSLTFHNKPDSMLRDWRQVRYARCIKAIICDSVQIIEDCYDRMVVRDVVSREKNLAGSTQVFIQVKLNIFGEFITRASKIRKCELKLNGNIRDFGSIQ